TTDGDNTERNAEAGAAQPCWECFFEFCPGQSRTCDFAVAKLGNWLALFVYDADDFVQCEDADGDNNDADAVEHFWDSAGKALGAGDCIDAYRRDEQTNDQGNQAAKQGVRDDRCRGQEGEDCQGEVLCWAKGNGKLSALRCEENDQGGDDQATGKSGDGGCRERLRRSAAQSHSEAFEGSCMRRRTTRGIDQNRHGGVAEETTEVHTREHNERGGWVEGKRNGQQKRYGHRRAHAR